MPDPFANSTARLEELVRQVMKELDPARYDMIAAEIRHALEERECLRSALDQGNLDQDKDCRRL